MELSIKEKQFKKTLKRQKHSQLMKTGSAHGDRESKSHLLIFKIFS
jgi:hypothetical protein